MNMIESVKTCFRKYTDFSGRASRSEFWWFMLFCLIPMVVFEFVDFQIFSFFPEGEYTATFYTTLLTSLGLTNGLFGTLSALALLAPSLAVTARRLHDVNLSGWWQMALYGVFFLDLPFNQSSENDLMFLIPSLIMLLVILAFIVLWARKGSPDLNRYGPPTNHEDTMAAFD